MILLEVEPSFVMAHIEEISESMQLILSCVTIDHIYQITLS